MAAKPNVLGRDAILAARPRVEKVDVPELGGVAYVRGFTAAERDEWEVSMLERRKTNDYTRLRASMVALAACDADGNRLFSEADVMALGDADGRVLARMHEAAARLNGLTAADEEELLGN